NHVALDRACDKENPGGSSGQRLCCVASIGVLLFAIASAPAQTTPAAQTIVIRAGKLFDAKSGRLIGYRTQDVCTCVCPCIPRACSRDSRLHRRVMRYALP